MSETDVLLNLRGMYPSLRPAEQRVAKQIMKNPQEVVHRSITQLAKGAEVSDATVVKFCKRIGYKGFQDLKIRLAQNIATRPEPIYGQIDANDSLKVITEKIMRTNMQALEDTMDTLDSRTLELAVEKLSRAHRIQVYGMGASRLVAYDAQQKFMRIGLNCVALGDSHEQTAMAALLGPDDAAVAITYSGETWEVMEALRTAKAAGAFTICLTSFPQSSVTAYADAVLLAAAEETILRSGAIASRIAQLSVVDTVFIGVLLARQDEAIDCIDRTRAALHGRNPLGSAKRPSV